MGTHRRQYPQSRDFMCEGYISKIALENLRRPIEESSLNLIDTRARTTELTWLKAYLTFPHPVRLGQRSQI